MQRCALPRLHTVFPRPPLPPPPPPPSRIRKGISQAYRMIARASAGVLIRGGFAGCPGEVCLTLECRGGADGIKLVTRAVGTNQYFLGSNCRRARLVVFIRPALPGAMRVRRRDPQGLCRCGVERVVPSQLPWSSQGSAQAEQGACPIVCSDRIANRPLCHHVRSVGLPILDPGGCSPWPWHRAGCSRQG